MIAFTVYGVPIPKGSTKAFFVKSLGRPIVTNANKKTKPWAQQITSTASASYRGPVLEGPLAVILRFYMPRPKSLPKKIVAHVRKPDCDKLTRSVLDALTGVIWRDDSQVVLLTASKAYAGGSNDTRSRGAVPRVEITITAVVLQPSTAPTQTLTGELHGIY
jgi:Holliday junction resolvase RusA-like endonuclease